MTICCNQLLFIVHIHHAVIKHREEVTVLSCKDDLMSSRWLAAGSAAWSGSCVHGRALHCSSRQTKREDYFETIAVTSKPYGFCGRKATVEEDEMIDSTEPRMVQNAHLAVGPISSFDTPVVTIFAVGRHAAITTKSDVSLLSFNMNYSSNPFHTVSACEEQGWQINKRNSISPPYLKSIPEWPSCPLANSDFSHTDFSQSR